MQNHPKKLMVSVYSPYVIVFTLANLCICVYKFVYLQQTDCCIAGRCQGCGAPAEAAAARKVPAGGKRQFQTSCAPQDSLRCAFLVFLCLCMNAIPAAYPKTGVFCVCVHRYELMCVFNPSPRQPQVCLIFVVVRCIVVLLGCRVGLSRSIYVSLCVCILQTWDHGKYLCVIFMCLFVIQQISIVPLHFFLFFFV